jgi:hypothetical protein
LSDVVAWSAIRDIADGRKSLSWLRSEAHKLTRRADRVVGRVLPEFIESPDPIDTGVRMIAGGARSAAIHRAATRSKEPPFDIYMPRSDAEVFRRRTSFTTITGSPNVILHSVRDDLWPVQGLFDRSTTDPVTAWLDLHESVDRGEAEAWQALLRHYSS